MSFDYIEYWDKNYKAGGTSGSGSYGNLADFKAEVVNNLITKNQIQTVIEFGCGDGNQLSLMQFAKYLGLDVASSSIRLCTEKFKDDETKSFMLYTPSAFTNRGFMQADMVICLDVLYHITDDADFMATLSDLFKASTNLVVLYTKLTTGNELQVIPTIKDRDIFGCLSKYSDFHVEAIIPQRYKNMSSADFIILRKSV
jgi:2-polyprenyl-3-methyl-5-hydroxy-6-metoxy-1,4-benzoquinol methylase